MNALQRYSNAMQLNQSPSPLSSGNDGPTSSKNLLNPQNSSEGGLSFKGELAKMHGPSSPHSLINQIKKPGLIAEKDALNQIMGAGNLEQTAVSMEAAKTYLDVVSRILQMSVEKLEVLTKGTMNG